MVTINISVPSQMKDWVQLQIDEGRYDSASDYLRALIRKDLNEREAALQAAITRGVESGQASELDMAAIKRKARQGKPNVGLVSPRPHH